MPLIPTSRTAARAELIAANGEDLGGEGGQWPVHGGLHQGHGDDEPEQHAEDGAGGDEQQDGVDRDDRGETAGDHDGAAADPVGQGGVGGEGEDLQE